MLRVALHICPTISVKFASMGILKSKANAGSTPMKLKIAVPPTAVTGHAFNAAQGSSHPTPTATETKSTDASSRPTISARSAATVLPFKMEPA